MQFYSFTCLGGPLLCTIFTFQKSRQDANKLKSDAKLNFVEQMECIHTGANVTMFCK